MASVSVIIPSFNSGAFLARAVDSVLAQTFADFEIVVVDDGSYEPPVEIGERDDRIRLITQRNSGVSVARNVGVCAARADLIAFLDHDDEWLASKLELQLSLVDSAPHAAFWCTGFDWVHEDSVIPSDPAPPTYRGLLSTQSVLLSSAIVRKSDYWRVGGHDPLLSQMQDWDLFLKMAMDGRRPELSTARLVRYHLHGLNASRNYRAAAAERFSILDAHERRARRSDDIETIAAIRRGRRRTRELFAHQAVDATRADLAQSRRRAAAGHFAYASGMSPRIAAASIGQTAAKKLGTRGHDDGTAT